MSLIICESEYDGVFLCIVRSLLAGTLWELCFIWNQRSPGVILYRVGNKGLASRAVAAVQTTPFLPGRCRLAPLTSNRLVDPPHTHTTHVMDAHASGTINKRVLSTRPSPLSSCNSAVTPNSKRINEPSEEVCGERKDDPWAPARRAG